MSPPKNEYAYIKQCIGYYIVYNTLIYACFLYANKGFDLIYNWYKTIWTPPPKKKKKKKKNE